MCNGLHAKSNARRVELATVQASHDLLFLLDLAGHPGKEMIPPSLSETSEVCDQPQPDCSLATKNTCPELNFAWNCVVCHRMSCEPFRLLDKFFFQIFIHAYYRYYYLFHA